MIGIDTNILFYALNPKSKYFPKAKEFVEAVMSGGEHQVVMTDYVLVELYNLLRNPAVMDAPLSSKRATQVVTSYLKSPIVTRAESAPIMDKVWKITEGEGFARRRIFDVRLALTLQHHGVTQFMTANVKDFQDLGFDKVCNPIIEAW